MNYTISIILITISFFLSVFYTSPLLGELDILSIEKASLNASLGDSKGLRTTVAEKEVLYNNLSEDDKVKLNKLLPNSIDNVKLIIDIDNIASLYNLKLRNIDIKADAPGEFSGDSFNNPYGTAMLRFSVSAPYESFKSFLTDLEDSLRLVDISSLTFTSGDKDINEYNIELKTYWLKETI